MAMAGSRTGEPEPEPLEKKTGTGAGVLLVCGERKIANEPEPGVFGPLEPEPLEKNTRRRSRLGKKSGAGAA